MSTFPPGKGGYVGGYADRKMGGGGGGPKCTWAQVHFWVTGKQNALASKCIFVRVLKLGVSLPACRRFSSAFGLLGKREINPTLLLYVCLSIFVKARDDLFLFMVFVFIYYFVFG